MSFSGLTEKGGYSMSGTLFGAALTTVALVTCFSARAQGAKDLFADAPRAGLLTSTGQGNSISYSCDQVDAGELTCSFTQTAVLPKSTYGKLADAVIEARNRYRTEKSPSAAECATVRDVAAVLEGKKAAPKREAVNTISPVEKADNLQIARAFSKYCDKPTEENFLAITRLSQNQDRRTCVVVANTWKHTFQRVDEPSKRVWVVKNAPPHGPCGVVQLSRFESEQTPIGSSTVTAWKYIARKAITNPTGDASGLGKCSDIVDERPYTYDWQSTKKIQMSCDYVEFTYSVP